MLKKDAHSAKGAECGCFWRGGRRGDYSSLFKLHVCVCLTSIESLLILTEFTKATKEESRAAGRGLWQESLATVVLEQAWPPPRLGDRGRGRQSPPGSPVHRWGPRLPGKSLAPRLAGQSVPCCLGRTVRHWATEL